MALTAESYCERLILLNFNSTNGGELLLQNINGWRVTAFITNGNENLFCGAISGDLLCFWRHSYRNSPKTLSFHSP